MKFVVWGVLLLSFSCGLKPGSNSANDPAPSYPIVKQGTFIGQNGRQVSGGAIVYNPSGSDYIFRLAGISTPEEGGLQVRAVTQGGTNILVATLRASSGNQNYYYTAGGATVWSQVVIYSGTNSIEYGLAVLP